TDRIGGVGRLLVWAGQRSAGTGARDLRSGFHGHGRADVNRCRGSVGATDRAPRARRQSVVGSIGDLAAN
ncbi:MAG: hypothetical protein ACO4B6_09845, partial [Ilumatobacteraceae bacterium]